MATSAAIGRCTRRSRRTSRGRRQRRRLPQRQAHRDGRRVRRPVREVRGMGVIIGMSSGTPTSATPKSGAVQPWRTDRRHALQLAHAAHAAAGDHHPRGDGHRAGAPRRYAQERARARRARGADRPLGGGRTIRRAAAPRGVARRRRQEGRGACGAPALLALVCAIRRRRCAGRRPIHQSEKPVCTRASWCPSWRASPSLWSWAPGRCGRARCRRPVDLRLLVRVEGVDLVDVVLDPVEVRGRGVPEPQSSASRRRRSRC